jgi:hypothetical protein
MRIQLSRKDCPRCGSGNSMFADGPKETFCLLCGFRSYAVSPTARKLKLPVDSYPLLDLLATEFGQIHEECIYQTVPKKAVRALCV